MRILSAETSLLLLIDFQARLMPAIEGGSAAVANGRRLADAADLLDVPVLATEQNPSGLGPTVPDLARPGADVIAKMTFDATRAPGLRERIGGRGGIVVAGCEAHVCVLQTVLGLLDAGLRPFVARDAVASRRAESKAAALARMERHGAEIVTAEMVIFEWLGSADHPRFRDALALIK